MKAILCRRPGRPEVLELEDIDKPSIADDGVLDAKGKIIITL